MENADNETQATASKDKPRRTRVVPYERTNKQPHSYRYKRGSTFVARAPKLTLTKEPDGKYVIGPTPRGVDSEPTLDNLEDDELELEAIKKMENGKQAIKFKSKKLGTVVAYDARSAREALRTS